MRRSAACVVIIVGVHVVIVCAGYGWRQAACVGSFVVDGVTMQREWIGPSDWSFDSACMALPPVDRRWHIVVCSVFMFVRHCAADVFEAVLVLFRVATLSGWSDVARACVAARSDTLAPGPSLIALAASPYCFPFFLSRPVLHTVSRPLCCVNPSTCSPRVRPSNLSCPVLFCSRPLLPSPIPAPLFLSCRPSPSLLREPVDVLTACPCVEPCEQLRRRTPL
jgi:hypothetical protein